MSDKKIDDPIKLFKEQHKHLTNVARGDSNIEDALKAIGNQNPRAVQGIYDDIELTKQQEDAILSGSLAYQDYINRLENGAE